MPSDRFEGETVQNNNDPNAGGIVRPIINSLQAMNRNISELITAIKAIFPRIYGSFTMGAAATKTVTDSRVKVGAQIYLQPTNAAAGTLVGSVMCPYIDSVASGSFVVKTASGAAAAGTETFNYLVINPA